MSVRSNGFGIASVPPFLTSGVLPSPKGYYMATADEILIAADGLTCRQDSHGTFGSAIGVKPVTSGTEECVSIL